MSLEVPTSPGLVVSRFAAGLETANLHHETISPDLSFCGITKLEDLQSADILHKIGLTLQVIPAYLGEVRQVLELLQAAGVDPRQIRRTLRERIGDGGYQHAEREPISRSDAVRAAFNRASEIAADQNVPIIMVQHLLAALLEIPDTHTRALLTEMGVDVDKLRDDAAALPVPKPIAPNGGGILDQLGIDLIEKARAGELAPVIGRKDEMMQVIKTLGRSKKNCPVLVGAAGVGKSAIVEGLAQRIADRRLNVRILDDFQGKRIVQISASSLVSGTKYRGDFEERMERLIAEVRADPNLILFVDEIHLLVGAGASGGGMDAANILKPALASGEIKLIGATTDAEYRQYIEKDAALERRFQRVVVEEPSPQETVDMLAGVRGRLQDKHQVTITDEAIVAAVELAVRYITDQQLPDKAYTLLDDACAWVRYGSVLSAGPLADSGEVVLNEVTPETVRA
ncbi:MAG: AAA family ATPase, partial [Anaerolineae bacterium]|nr:AAA family ATPase [Anaerolineae bacterium]